MSHGAIHLIEHREEPAAVVCGHVAAAELPRFLGSAFGRVWKQLSAQHVAAAGPPFARYRPTEDGFDVEAGFPAAGAVAPADDVHPATLPGGVVASAMHYGDYAELGKTYRDITQWLPDHGYRAAGAPWESYLDGPEMAEPRTVVSFPCVPA